MGGSPDFCLLCPQGVSSAHGRVVSHARAANPLTGHMNLFPIYSLGLWCPVAPLRIYNHPPIDLGEEYQ